METTTTARPPLTPRTPAPTRATAPPAHRPGWRRVGAVVAEAGLLLACLLCGVVLVGITIDAGRGDGWVALDVLLALVGTPGLLLRRRWPVAVAVALAACAALSGGVAPAALVALFGAARRRSWAWACVPAAVLALAAATDGLLHPEPGSPAWLLALVALGVVAPVVGWGAYRGAREHLLAALRQRALDAEADLHQRQEQARTRERARIAREMHDVLAHRLSLVSLHAGALEVAIDAPRADLVRAAEAVRSSAHAALEDLREVLGVLRADEVAPDRTTGDAPRETGHQRRPQPTLAHLPALVAEARATGTDVELDHHVGAEVPQLVARTALRVVQEGLTNARKHAPGHRVLVRLRAVASGSAAGGTLDAVEVVVEDSAAGAPGHPSGVPGAGVGLVGLAERVHLAGGRLESSTTPTGFRLRAVLPLHRGAPGGTPDSTPGGAAR